MATQYKPILFSTEMVQAILEGRKTQTRRIIKPQPEQSNVILDGIKQNVFMLKDCATPKGWLQHKLHNFKIGDILWVREKFEYFGATFYPHDDDNIELCGSVIFNYYASKNQNLKEIPTKNKLADYAFKNIDKGWKPSIHMPKEAARIFLEVTNVRVERLKDISEEDAIAEGIDKKGDLYFNYFESKLLGKGLPKEYFYKEIPKVSFMSLWSKINGIDSWKANPWVWVYEFKVVEKPKYFLNE